MISTDGVVYFYVIFFCFIVGVRDVEGGWEGVGEVFCTCSAVGDVDLVVFGIGELGGSGGDCFHIPSS